MLPRSSQWNLFYALMKSLLLNRSLAIYQHIRVASLFITNILKITFLQLENKLFYNVLEDEL
jgi:hypothetical protein